MAEPSPTTPDAALLRAILDAAVDAIITIDERGTIQSANRAAKHIFGYGADELIGNNVKMLMPPPYAGQHDQYLDRYVATGEAKIIGVGREVEGRRKDGTTFPMHLGVSEVRGGGKRTFTGIIQDVTARRELERAREAVISQLEDANAELEQFTYTVSHDLKSPLITIKGFLGTLERDAVSGNLDRLRADIARIAGAADKMTQLLDELLELSRVGRIANPHQDVPMTVLCAEIVALLDGPISQSGAQVAISPDLPRLRCDRVRIGEVIQNLVENALKFARETGEVRIHIGVRHDGDRTVFYVRDNGVGIDPRYKDRVFRLFEQLDNQEQGTGIGLALVKRIIEVHGGNIWVESEGLGTGSTFCFALPATRAAEEGTSEGT